MKILPSRCPACKSRLKWTQTKTDLYCSNDDCGGSDVRKISHFFSVLGADGITETTVIAMAEAGLKSIPQILTANKKQISLISKFADKKTQAMLLNLKKLTENVSLPKLMHASGIFADISFGIGKTLLEPIVQKFGQRDILHGKIDPIKMKLAIVSMPNMGAKRAELFVANLPRFREFYSTLQNIKLVDTSGGKLAGKVYAFTSFRDAELEKKIELNGGRVSGNMSKNVHVLFAAAPSVKTELADKYGTKVVMRQDVDKYFKGVGL